MSQLLDALRRASRPARAVTAPRGEMPHADRVFATLRSHSADRRRNRMLAAAALLAVAMIGVWAARRWTGVGEAPPAEHARAAPASQPPRPIEHTEPFTSPALPAQGRPAAPAASEPRETRVRRGERTEPVEPAAAIGSPPPTTAAERFGAAVDLQRAGDLDTAVERYRQLLASGALVPQVHNNLGLLYQTRGELAAAVSEFERAIESDPAYARAYNNLGVVLLEQGRVREATARFTRAASLDPRDPDPVVNLALAQRAAGETQQACESLLRALTLAPESAAAHYNLAVLYDRSGENARAAEHYKAFLAAAGAEYPDRAAEVRARLGAVEKLLH